MTSPSTDLGPTRWVIIDDSNPRINYSEPEQWSAKQSTSGDQGLTGLPFNNTLHAATSKNHVRFSFSFTGTRVDVYSVDNFVNISGVTTPSVECFIDNINSQMEPSSFNGNPANNWMMCSQYNLEDRLHTVIIDSLTTEQAFLFDRIQYLPSSNSTMENQTVYIDNPDPSIIYGPGWEGLGRWFSYTTTKGTALDFEFTGISLQWYGVTPAVFPGIPSTITYTIDGGSPQVVILPGHSNNSPNLSNQKYFEISTLSMGKHQLSVVYNGNSTTTPLTLDYFVVQNGSITYTPPPPVTYTPITNNTVEKHSTHIGAIVGGTLSAIIIVTFIVALLFFLRRRKLAAAKRNVSANEVHPFDVWAFRRPSTTNSKGVLSSSVPTIHNSQISPLLKSSQGHDEDEELPTPFPPVHDTGSPPQVQVIRHQDSGLRTLDESQRATEIVEIPPEYTPG
ncbi:hypothetical protein CPB83DRAFT_844537 [Crepidotus variabilis]|uniref:Transmembrane protein n=1 Tax=Crepidotus variabilis TaxID=179855 RepID=A0A9P6EPU6_9AGAR|nr:hypothetical protein CPB83DRAFT_844537 [Crepidotus variabilis]